MSNVSIRTLILEFVDSNGARFRYQLIILTIAFFNSIERFGQTSKIMDKSGSSDEVLL